MNAAASPLVTFTADIRSEDGRSHSYVYFPAASRGDASHQLDRWLRAVCVDPQKVDRFGWAFDQFDGRWLLTQDEELRAEFGRTDLAAVVAETL
jgi:hypothetical protein